MRKGIVILAAIVVITISAAVVAAAVANMSDEPSNSQQMKGLAYGVKAQSQMTALDAAGDVIMEYRYLEMPFDADLNRRLDLGHVVHSTLPGPFIVEGVVINGTYHNDSGPVPFALELWDDKGGLLYKLTDISVAYFSTEPGLAVIEIPAIKTDGDFTVIFYSRTSVSVGAYIGALDNRSFVVARDLGMIPAVTLEGHPFEWAIGVAGRDA